MIMIRTFDEWWKSLPNELRTKYGNEEKPPFSHVNYIWVTNLISNVSDELNPTVEELLDWIITEQIDAKRK